MMEAEQYTIALIIKRFDLLIGTGSNTMRSGVITDRILSEVL